MLFNFTIMSISKKIYVVVLLLLLVVPGLSQNTDRIEQLKHIIDSTDEDTIKVIALLGIARSTYSYNTDTAILVCKEALSISDANNYAEGKIKAYSWLGYLYNKEGYSDTALLFYKRALATLEKQEKPNYGILSSLINNIAYTYDLQGNIPFALRYYNKSLQISESRKDTANMIKALSNIATLYYTQRDTANAKKYLDIVYELQKATNDQRGIANTLNIFGDYYTKAGYLEKGLDYYKRSLAIKEKYNDYGSIGLTLSKIGGVYLERKEYDTALQYFNKALAFQKKVSQKRGQASTLYNIGTTYFRQNKIDVAKQYALKSLKLSKEIGHPSKIKKSADLLNDIYVRQKDWKKAYKMLLLSNQMRDSILNYENQKAIIRHIMKYEYEKQAAIDSIAYAKEMEIKNMEARRNRAQRNYSIISLLVALLLLAVIFRNYRLKKRAYILLEKQKQEISLQAEKLEKANLEITKNHKHITDSINYARRIQAALLPSVSLFDEYFAEYFIFFKPKEIVSGDFYYLKKINKFIILVVADSTGHGVPGAFVSMLGIAFLNEIIRRKEVTTAAQVLEILRSEFKNSLNKNNKENKSYDGMDVALCVIDTETKMLQFSGAYNSIYIIRKKDLIEIKGTKSPIGIFYIEKDFKNNVFQLKDSDIIYLFSDGFSDQFGGIKKAKFSNKRFKELLLSISDLPLEEQESILSNSYEKWRGDNKQTDDILVVGVKV